IFVHREAADLAEEVRAAKTLVAGPGMGTDAESHETLGRMLGAATCPVLLDADALTLLAANPSLLPAAIASRTLLTPHPGEMARLLGCLVEDVAADPFAAVEEASSRFGCTVMLKGMPTLLAAPGAPTRASIAGHSGVGVGGMGDTLAGLAGALLARGMGVTDAAALAIH